jgi:hypothetical protein
MGIFVLLSLVVSSLPVYAAKPVARDDAYVVNEDSQDNRLDVLDNDSDRDGDTLTIVAVTQGTKGTVVIIDGGARLSYTPLEEEFGSDSFTYTVFDGKNGSDSAQVEITITAINDPPIARDDEAATKEDIPVGIAVLANDDDPDGFLNPSTVRRISGPSHGSVIAHTGIMTYTPSLNWYGDDAFTYEVCDDGTPLPVECDTATVSISVSEVNDPPVADAGPDQSAPTNSAIILDGSGSTDPEGDLPLNYRWEQVPSDCPTVFPSNPTGQTTTVTTPGDPCVLTFQLRVSDSRNTADLTPDQVVVTVTNRTPIANAGTDQRVPTGSLVQLDGANSLDPDDDYPLTYFWTQPPGQQIPLSNASSPTPTFTAPDRVGALVFALDVRDALGAVSSASDRVTIAVYEPPMYRAYLPSLTYNYAIGPDLVVESIQATANNVRVVIKNQGNAPVEDGFFVDAYINPSPPPTRVNQTWLDLSKHGLVWGVIGNGVKALIPGGSLTLEYNKDYYLADFSSFPGSLAPGTTIYAQVDSYNYPDTGHGIILETHEMLGGAYNNIRGPVFSVAALSTSRISSHPTDPEGYTKSPGPALAPNRNRLPARP